MRIMCGDMPTIRLVPGSGQLEWAGDYADRKFNYRHSTFRGTKATIFQGAVGERCVADHYDVEVMEHDNVNLVSHDLTMGRFKIDVKTTMRSIRPEPCHHCAIRENQFNANRNPYIIYVLNSFNQPANIMTICGWCTKKWMMRYGELRKKGEICEYRNDGTPMIAQETMWRIPVKNMFSLDDLEGFCNTWAPEDVPKWNLQQHISRQGCEG
jgi:hypothetical protein